MTNLACDLESMAPLVRELADHEDRDVRLTPQTH